MARGGGIKKIVLAFDSFKESLTSVQAAEAAERAIVAELPDCEVVKVAVADGGEGTVDAISASFGGDAERVLCRVSDPLGRSIETAYYILNGEIAIVDVAAASGLSLLAQAERNPMKTSTAGTGQMIAHALDRGCRKFIIGLGGSATNDAAMGILDALGYRFLDNNGARLNHVGENLAKVATINCDGADARLQECEFTLACDVTNPFYGENGAAYIYAPQKGADKAQVELLDAGLRHFSEVLTSQFGKDVSNVSGAGAAGGIGGTLCAVLGAKLCRGIDIVLDYADFDNKIADADLVITGEGAIDEQSGMGKAISGILSRAERCGVSVVALAGSVSGARRLNELGVKAVFSIQLAPITLADALKPENAMKGIMEVTSQVMRLLK